jgi:hypothetical protein
MLLFRLADPTIAQRAVCEGSKEEGNRTNGKRVNIYSIPTSYPAPNAT